MSSDAIRHIHAKPRASPGRSRASTSCSTLLGGAATMDKVESDLQNNFPIGWFEDKITREAENVGFLEGTRLTFCPGLP